MESNPLMGRGGDMGIVLLGLIPLLLVIAVCVSAGNVSEKDAQGDAAVRDQVKFEEEDARANRFR